MTRFVLGRLRARPIADREKIKSTILLLLQTASGPPSAALAELIGRGFVRVSQVNCAEQAACSPLSPIKHCKSKLRGEQAKQGSKWKTDDGGITILDGFCRRQPRIKTLSSF